MPEPLERARFEPLARGAAGSSDGVDFLPRWYPHLRRRQRLVMLQGWVAVVLAVGLSLWLFLAQRNVASAEAALLSLSGQLSETDQDLAKLEDLLVLQRQWRHQDQVISRLGLHVETSRMLSLLAATMPREMALIDLTIQVVEREPPLRATSLAGVRAAQEAGSRDRETSGQGDKETDRRMKVVLLGVAPTGVDLARFLTRLSNTPFLEQVSMKHLRDRSDGGHVMREFEVMFWVNLNE